MKNLHITCDNLEQREQVFEVLKSMGLKDATEINRNTNNVVVNPDRYFFAFPRNLITTERSYTFTQFMEQYSVNKLNQLIEQATTTLKISKSELSRRIKRSRNYLGEVQRRGASTQLQAELCEDIQAVLNGGEVKTDAEIIAELSEKLAEAQDLAKHNAEIELLKAANISLMQESDGYHNANTELNQELNAMRKIEQERSDELKTANELVTLVQDKNAQLCESMEKCTTLNKELSAENRELLRSRTELQRILRTSEQNAEYQLSRVPVTVWAAFMLFIRMLFGGRA